MALRDSPTASCLVDEGLHALADGLGPFVLGVLRQIHGERWWDKAVVPVLKAPDRERVFRKTAADDRARIESLDERALLAVLISWWSNGFLERLAAPSRSYVGEALFYANWHAHQSKRDQLTMSEAARALDTMWRLLDMCARNERDQPLTSSLEKLARLRNLAHQQSGAEAEGLLGKSMAHRPQQDAVGGPPASAVRVTTRQFPLMDAYPFAERHGLGDTSEKVKAAQPPARTHRSVYRRALLARVFRQERLLDKFIDEHWPNGKTEDGQRILDAYERLLRLNDSAQLNGPVVPTGVTRGWGKVEELIGTVEGTEDLAEEHNHYLYGTPKPGDDSGP